MLHENYLASLLLRTHPPPSRLRLLSRASYTAYLAPLISPRDEEGFASCLACPCHRAVAGTPSEEKVATANMRHSLMPSTARNCLGLRGRPFRGYTYVHTCYGPATHSPSVRWLCQWASGHLISLLPAIQVKGLWLLPLRDCLSLDTPAFAGRTLCQDTYGTGDGLERAWRYRHQRRFYRWNICSCQKRGDGVGKTKKGKGTKIMASQTLLVFLSPLAQPARARMK